MFDKAIGIWGFSLLLFYFIFYSIDMHAVAHLQQYPTGTNSV